MAMDNFPTEILLKILTWSSTDECIDHRLVCRRWNSVSSEILEGRSLKTAKANVCFLPPWRMSSNDLKFIPSFVEVELVINLYERRVTGEDRESRIVPHHADILDVLSVLAKRFKRIRSLQMSPFHLKYKGPPPEVIERLVAIPSSFHITHFTVKFFDDQSDFELAVLYRMLKENPCLESFIVRSSEVIGKTSGFDCFHKACLAHPHLKVFGLTAFKRTFEEQCAQVMTMLRGHFERRNSLIYEFILQDHRERSQFIYQRLFHVEAHSSRMHIDHDYYHSRAYPSVLVFENAMGEPTVFFLTGEMRKKSEAGSFLLVLSKIEEAVEFHECVVQERCRRELADATSSSVAKRISFRVTRCWRYSFSVEMSCANPGWAAARIRDENIEEIARKVSASLTQSFGKEFAVTIAKTWTDDDSQQLGDDAPRELFRHLYPFRREVLSSHFQKYVTVDRELYAKELSGIPN